MVVGVRVILEVFREADGRLEGHVQLPDGHGDSFTSTLDLLRVLAELDLSRPGREPAPETQGAMTSRPRPGDRDA